MSEYDERSKGRPAQPEREQPPRRKRRRKRMGALGALVYVALVVGVSVLLAGLGWLAAGDVLALSKGEKSAVIALEESVFTSHEEKNSEGETVTLLRADLDTVSRQLKQEGIIEYPWLFRVFVAFTNKEDAMRPGSYVLDTTMDYSAIIRNLGARSGSKAEVTVVIQEGATSAQIFKTLEQNNVATVEELEEAAATYDFRFSFLREVVPLGEKTRLEGYLFPDTYQFYTNMDPVQALNKMLLRFDEVFTQEMRDEAVTNGQTVRDVVTIASLIEKETTGEDQARISSVIHNRLYRANSETAGFLNVDATIAYVTGRVVTQSDYQGVISPYNTYTNKGLPPGPIASPGQSALRAALGPEETNYYYYALGDDSAHHFFRTLSEQRAFIDSQALYKTNGG